MDLEKNIRVVELFAGVGGFRMGLENSDKKFKTVWSNQWEPNKKVQHASDCYVKNFGEEGHVCEDINSVIDLVPEHDLLVGGFPCQDYSVATTNAQGIHGKKGILWWAINDIIKLRRPSYVLLENVDRLLISPSKQRGRDFAIILWCLNDLGYNVEWRVINAADYGFPQKRRRVFIFATKNDSDIGRQMEENIYNPNYLIEDGIFTEEFPAIFFEKNYSDQTLFDGADGILSKDIKELSDTFEFKFLTSGVAIQNKIWTKKLRAIPSEKSTLRSKLQQDVEEKYYIPESDFEKWKYAKGAKNEMRSTKEGHTYPYNEGSLPFPDKLDEPGRTILTSEGNLTPSRIKHIILDPQTNRLRILTPIEVERLNGFPDNWTLGMPERMRYFCMGNALVIGVIEKIGKSILERISTLSLFRSDVAI